LHPKASEEFLVEFPGYSPIILQLLWNRGIKTQKEIEYFFYPDYKNLYDPFLMKGLKELDGEIRRALKKRKKIGIFTDFDVDGITGAAIFIETLLNLGFPKKLISFFIPDREKEGYGVNENGVKFLASQGSEIFITIDCGITNFKEIELARTLGMKPIVIDHHEIPKNLPKADIIVNPLQKNDKYPFKDLAAGGITFKIAQAFLKNKKGGEEKLLLDLAALATIADCCPLLDENRILVSCGLGILRQTKRVGLEEIIRFFRIEKSKLDTFDVSHKIAPLLNAASRMDHANNAYELITTDSIFEAAYLTKKLNEKNRKRQELSRKILGEIDERLSKYKTLPKIIVEADEDWPLTIAGPIAARVLEKYARPAIIFKREKEISQSSSRSLPGLDMVKVFEKCASHLERFGGHPLAAGCTVLNENFEKLKACFERVAERELAAKNLSPVLEIESEVKSENLNLDFYNEIQKFAPFGPKNQKPKFLIKNLEIEDIKKVGKSEKHLKFLLKLTNNRFVKGILFQASDRLKDLKEGKVVDAVFELDIDEWNGYRELLLKIIDLKTCKK